jgi:hypothetical protein
VGSARLSFGSALVIASALDDKFRVNTILILIAHHLVALEAPLGLQGHEVSFEQTC